MVRIIVYSDDLPVHAAAVLMNAVCLGARGRMEAMAYADEVVVVLKQRDPSKALVFATVQMNLEGEVLTTPQVVFLDAAKVDAIQTALRKKNQKSFRFFWTGQTFRCTLRTSKGNTP